MRGRGALRRTAIAMTAACVASCAASDAEPAETPAPVELIEPSDPAMLRADLTAARSAWAQSVTPDYGYDVTVQCQNCLVDGTTLMVAIVAGARSDDGAETGIAAFAPGVLGPIEEIHDFIEGSIDVGFVIDTTYDVDGRPIRFVISSEDVNSSLDVDLAQTTFRYVYE